MAAQEGHKDDVTQLLAANANVNQPRSFDGATPLHIAAQNGHTDVVVRLLAGYADVDKATNTGLTPLYIAAQNGHADVVTKLLVANADVDKTLLIAVEKGNLKIARTLFERACTLNLQSTPVVQLLNAYLRSLIEKPQTLLLWVWKTVTFTDSRNEQIIKVIKLREFFQENPHIKIDLNMENLNILNPQVVDQLSRKYCAQQVNQNNLSLNSSLSNSAPTLFPR